MAPQLDKWLDKLSSESDGALEAAQKELREKTAARTDKILQLVKED